MAPIKKADNRLTVIDDIRGISIIVMIMIHTNAYFLGNRLAYKLVEISQFAVVAFIFCSAYLFYQKGVTIPLAEFWGYFKKRTYRLIAPYYVFLLIYTFFILLKEPARLTYSYLVHNLTLVSGIEFNWLVLLFIQLVVLMPVFSFLRSKHKHILYIYTGIAIVASILFLKHTPLSYFRLIMWLPWSLVVIYTMFFDQLKEHKKLFFSLTILFLLIYVASSSFLSDTLHRSLRMYANKYPPNIYHLAYSLFCVNILYMLSKLNVFSVARRIIHFFSKYSYTIFFIHILVIHILTVFLKVKFGWIGLFAVTTAITSALQIGYNLIFSPRYKAG